MRVDHPSGWPWTVRRRWLPWRPRVHRAVAFCYLSTGNDDPISVVFWALVNIPCLLMVVVLAVEWLLLLSLLPVVLVARLLGMRIVVMARGRRDDGVRLLYETVARRWASARLRDEVAQEIRTYGMPRSLGDPVTVTGESDDGTARMRERLAAGQDIGFHCRVQGFGGARSRTDWVEGRLSAMPGQLEFFPANGFGRAPWYVPGGDDVRVSLAGPADGEAVGRRVVASYTSAAGPFRIAVDPHLGPLLRDVLLAGLPPAPDLGRLTWTMWRGNDIGLVYKVGTFATRADAEVRAAALEDRGSTHTFWVAATRV